MIAFSSVLPALSRLKASFGNRWPLVRAFATSFTRNDTIASGAHARTCQLTSRDVTRNKPFAVLNSLGFRDPFNGIGQCRHRSNRSRRGLYDGKDIRSGNKVCFSSKKFPRKFKPNVFVKRVYSEILDEMVRFHITTSALRSIDKAGGLDNYLLTSRHVTSGEGLKTKNRILRKMWCNKMEKAAKSNGSEETGELRMKTETTQAS